MIVTNDKGTVDDPTDDEFMLKTFTYQADRRAMWKMGTKYIYNLEFNMNEITVTADVQDWSPESSTIKMGGEL